jgi:hypothetical protein
MIDKPLGALDDFDRTEQRQALQPNSDRTLLSPQFPEVQHLQLPTPLIDTATERTNRELPLVPPFLNHENRSEESFPSSSPPSRSDLSTQADIPVMTAQSAASSNLTSIPAASSLDTLLEALEAEVNRDYYRHYGS